MFQKGRSRRWGGGSGRSVGEKQCRHNSQAPATDQPSSPPLIGRTSYARAAAGYDEQFRRELAGEIITAIAKASVVADAPVMAIRTTETLDALADALVTVLAIVPRMDVPSELRKAAEALARRLRRDVARARAEGAADILGARVEGHA
jgi:hypothetical protein